MLQNWKGAVTIDGIAYEAAVGSTAPAIRRVGTPYSQVRVFGRVDLRQASGTAWFADDSPANKDQLTTTDYAMTVDATIAEGY